jgi:hypothetical protein
MPVKEARMVLHTVAQLDTATFIGLAGLSASFLFSSAWLLLGLARKRR